MLLEMINMYEVIYFTDGDTSPVVDYMMTLSPKERAKILREIDLLEKFGYQLGMPHSKKMTGTDELWELRIKLASNNHRVFYFHFINNKFVLLHAFRKKSQKTPKKEINLALKRIKQHKQRSDYNES